MHKARALLRAQSRQLYDRTDPRFDKSEFDSLMCTIKEDADGYFWVYVERHNADIIAIESLSDD